MHLNLVSPENLESTPEALLESFFSFFPFSPQSSGERKGRRRRVPFCLPLSILPKCVETKFILSKPKKGEEKKKKEEGLLSIHTLPCKAP